MTKFTVVLEQGEDRGWGAYSLSPSVVAGLGDTKEEAIEDWKEAMRHWLAYMKETNQEVTVPVTELVSVEVTA
jgi:predicted RNase H-like HicB family nuclease